MKRDNLNSDEQVSEAGEQRENVSIEEDQCSG